MRVYYNRDKMQEKNKMNKIIYLDAAATYQKENAVIDAQVDFLRTHYANAGRGVCARANYVDSMVARTRAQVADFIGAGSNQIVFCSGTTAGMNMIVNMVCPQSGVRVAVSDLDHHSARLPWQQSGADIVVCPLDNDFNIDINNLPYADIFVITAMSNVLGIAQDVGAIVRAAKQKNPNVITVVDAAQFVVHNEIDVRKFDCDFLCFSGHKIGSDTGIGVMYIKNPNRWSPVMFGGGMVNKIVNDKIVWNDAPDVFEAGTLPLTQIAGLGVAIDCIKQNRPDTNLIKYMYDELVENPKIKILSRRDAVILDFVVRDMHVLDFGALIGARGVCLRVGNMCATWIHNLLNVPGSIRISVGAYNSFDDVRQTVEYIREIVK